MLQLMQKRAVIAVSGGSMDKKHFIAWAAIQAPGTICLQCQPAHNSDPLSASNVDSDSHLLL